MTLKFSHGAGKTLAGMDSKLTGRIVKALLKLPDGDVVPLQGAEDSFRLRVGDFRILFSWQAQDIVLVERIAPRGDVYKGV
ncbi:hypothetical protein FACS1894217_09310 [Clostridia bacterium]|nr:hypothetical protein FACS1894217_09310 [Clostridia bacterium]